MCLESFMFTEYNPTDIEGRGAPALVTSDALCGGVNSEGVFVHPSHVHRNPLSAE